MKRLTLSATFIFLVSLSFGQKTTWDIEFDIAFSVDGPATLLHLVVSEGFLTYYDTIKLGFEHSDKYEEAQWPLAEIKEPGFRLDFEESQIGLTIYTQDYLEIKNGKLMYIALNDKYYYLSKDEIQMLANIVADFEQQ